VVEHMAKEHCRTSWSEVDHTDFANDCIANEANRTIEANRTMESNKTIEVNRTIEANMTIEANRTEGNCTAKGLLTAQDIRIWAIAA
jgi:hypothetical protein